MHRFHKKKIYFLIHIDVIGKIYLYSYCFAETKSEWNVNIMIFSSTFNVLAVCVKIIIYGHIFFLFYDCFVSSWNFTT
jgi:hypothetical protein